MTTAGPHVPELYVPRGSAANAQYVVDIDPERAGWTRGSLRVVELGPDGTHHFTTGDSEWIVLPLGGGCTVRIADEEFQLLGRESVFAGVTDFAYVPRDAQVKIASGAGGRFALAGAKCERRLPARYGPAPEVPVDRHGDGAGPPPHALSTARGGTRTVRGFAAADAFVCDTLLAVEVITPGGSWSSCPPYPYDEQRAGGEAELEEIYYFEIDGPNGFGQQRVFPSREGGADVLTEVRSGDAVLVPDGRYGSSVAQPGHDMYCLNVMAGPGGAREWRICFHPEHTEGYR
ncbi:5-deoxy-glucuronate isomerase [Streptomyces sp. NPDC091219]|uniref:5-deoxy-glucuronate isomerase n=1 Tax=Streptomyces sp. NPDC091219 TaxID=3155193 RepID=UPI00344FF3AE